MIPPALHPRRNRPHAFTLVELVVAMGIMTMLLLAVQGTIVLASRSIPDARSKATSLITASCVLDALNADLTFATAITARTATAITVQVPDRNGDGNPDTITWTWNGSRGSSLTRTLNTGAPVPYATNVQAFSLNYDVRTTVAPQTYTAGPETLFLSVPSALLTNTTNTIQSTRWFGQYFKPNLPANATSWAVTRVQLKIRNHSSSVGQTAIQIRPVNPGNLPTATVLDQVICNESSLDSSYLWTQFTFANANNLNPNSGAALTLVWLADTEAMDVQGQTITALLSGGNQLKSDGNTWNAQTLNSLNCYIYGTCTTPNPPSNLYYLTGARATLRTSADTGATARNTIRMINEIQVPAP